MHGPLSRLPSPKAVNMYATSSPASPTVSGKPKIHNYGSGDWGFHCVGCGYEHSFRVTPDASRPQWKWNGSVERPTFYPSLVVNRDHPKSRCHLIMTDGRIQYLQDCWHKLAGQMVEVPDWED